MDNNFDPSVVVTNGSLVSKAGLAGDEEPKAVFPTIIGNLIKEIPEHTTFVGDEAQSKRDILSLKYPIECGIVKDWDGMEKIWSYIFNEKLNVAPEDMPLLSTEAPFNPKIKREKMTEIMFETFKVPAFYMTTDAVLSMYGLGRTEGVAVDFGHRVTHCVPVYEGYAMPHYIKTVNIGGDQITSRLMDLLNQNGKGNNFNPEDKYLVRDMMETLCYVALDFDQELSNLNSLETYKLPDGQVISLDNERFSAPEALFQSSLIGQDMCGIHEATAQCLNSNRELRMSLYSSIVLSGGLSLMPGLADRLNKELVALAAPSTRIRIRCFPDDENTLHQKNLSWIGGSVLGSLSTFKQMLISQQEYEDSGPSIVNTKCF